MTYRVRRQALTGKLRQLWIAIESGWRAGLKQYRTMRTKQRNAATLDTPF